MVSFSCYHFWMETALISLRNANPFILYPTSFLQGHGIPINGLVWMNTADEMLKEALQKSKPAFTCIKFKIGALDFDEECRMLERFRQLHTDTKIDIRLDANGAFKPDEALEQLKQLSRFGIHSIEQPIAAGQIGWMEEICAKSKISIALDEELIGIRVDTDGQQLIKSIKPQYLVLKPTLLGGVAPSESWIRLARQFDMGWWITSALESNIGLNAIAQWSATQTCNIPQGLGTGHLYANNFKSPLFIDHGSLFYSTNQNWEMPF